ncbi:MAG: N-acetylglucosamine-6-phosphate deacetylase [Sulfolobaceae archaeon]|nr:N-acetylglucosamine-6-phosphate deacetylase [Sulfolobaceae archaeon]
MKTLFKNAKIVSPEYEFIGYFVVDNGKIVKVREGHTLEQGIDLKGKIVIPGFIDIHVHGGFGIDFTEEASKGKLVEAIENYRRKIVKLGVTSFSPTTVTSPHEVLLQASKEISEVNMESDEGARVLGLHLEGPYISPQAAGAQDVTYIRPANIKELEEYWKSSNGRIASITVAPEIENALDFIEYATLLGIHVSIGHTNATYKQAIDAIRAGADRATHLFDAMTKIHHRDPGAVIAILQSDIMVELIMDTIHVVPDMIKYVISTIGVKRVIAVTDAMAAAGLGDGEYVLGSKKVKVTCNTARTEDGRLAGSVATMDRYFYTLLMMGYSLSDVSRMLSLNPARALNLKLGCIKPGCNADFIVLNSDMKIEEVHINGKKIV